MLSPAAARVCFFLSAAADAAASADNHWALSGLTDWAIAKAQWSPAEFDYDAARRNYATAAFGDAASDAAVDFFAFWENYTTSTYNNMTVRNMTSTATFGALQLTQQLYPEEVLSRGEELLGKVESSCVIDGCGERLQLFKTGMQHARLAGQAVTAVAAAELGACVGGRNTCQLGSVLPTLEALRVVRETAAANNAINVFELTVFDSRPGHDIAGQALAGAAHMLASSGGTAQGRTPVAMLPTALWKFAIDSADEGLAAHWYNKSAWLPRVPSVETSVGARWNTSSSVAAWSAAHGNKTYAGVGWYRVALEPQEAEAEGELHLVAADWCGVNITAWYDGQPLAGAQLPKSASAAAFVLPQPGTSDRRRGLKPPKPRMLTVRVDGGGARCEAGYGLTGYVWLVEKGVDARSPDKTDDRDAPAAEQKNDTCATTNTTFLELENICIHSDHSGACGTKGQDTLNVVLGSAAECRALCCERRDICAAYLYYESYKTTCCTGAGCTGNRTTPPSAPGAPCCWLKSAVAPAHLWSNDGYCSQAGVVYVPGPL